ncbi:MAG: hypothetical protein FJ285_08705, partial [Planctomycetes bacterium]|nr:hypothetical protein [Planctomycetota bacterium]
MLSLIAERPIPLDTGDFRLISRRVCNLLVSMPESQRYIRGMVSWVGFRQEPVLYDRDARAAGETKYPLRRLIALAANGVISSSVRPLMFASVLGVVAILVGLALTVYAVVSRADQSSSSTKYCAAPRKAHHEQCADAGGGRGNHLRGCIRAEHP